MAYYKELKGDELYLYMNGKLIYKRWLKTGQSKVFDVMAYDKYTDINIWRFLDKERSNPEIIKVKALLKMKSTQSGGRKTGFISGYRPNHVFEYSEIGLPLCTFIGDIQFEDQSTIEPGEEKEVTVRFLLDQPIEKYLNPGQTWWIHEAQKQIGEAKIIEIIQTT